MTNDMDFCHWQEIYPTNMGKNFGCSCKNRTRCCKNCFQKLVHKTAAARGELIESKITKKIIKRKLVSEGNSKNVEETNIPPEKRGEI